MPASARTRMRVWKNSRVVNTGSATHGVGERAVEINSDDIDISDTSNSAKRNCRQNISDGWRTVAVRSRPSALTAPSISGRVFGLLESAMLRGRRTMMIASLLLQPEPRHDRPPLVVLRPHVAGEIVGRAAARLGAEAGERVPHGGRLQRLVGCLVQTPDDRPRRAHGGQDRHPAAGVGGWIVEVH